jgi:ATP-binding cassette, subfamily C (CFTR/MRP), member 1
MCTKLISFVSPLSYNPLPLSDPLNAKTDAELISLLQRAWLLPQDGVKDSAAETKFSLDASVGDEGSNFSAGEKQLLALCRALVRGSSLIVLVCISASWSPGGC